MRCVVKHLILIPDGIRRNSWRGKFHAVATRMTRSTCMTCGLF
jgi:hypothetical protein